MRNYEIDLGQLKKIYVSPSLHSDGKWQEVTIHIDFDHQENTYFFLNRKQAKKLIEDINKWLDKE